MDGYSSKIRRLDLSSRTLERLLYSRLLPLIFVTILIAALGIGASGYFYYQYQKIQKQLKVKSQASTAKEITDETKKLIEEVNKLINLPKDEEPTIATVTDIEKLKDQPFFQKAKIGDKVLIYPKAQKSILYDPQAKRIVEAGFFTTALSEKELTITLRNGTSVSGLASKVEAEIKKTFPEAKISSEWSTQQDQYKQTLIVLLDDSAKDQAIDLAKTFNALIKDLPKDEEKPKDSKILIILGKDRI